MYAWNVAVTDAYEPIQYHKGWKKCLVCKEIPRIWIFDNGNFASCRCRYMYDPPQARAESIMSYVVRNNGSLVGHEDSQESLRKVWNKYIETGEEQINLPDGQW